MVAREALKPWPVDCVIVVACLAGAERREQMDSIHEDRCLECGRTVHYDGYTMDRCKAMPQRCGRPIRFLCHACFPLYGFGQVTYHEDHRHHRG